MLLCISSGHLLVWRMLEIFWLETVENIKVNSVEKYAYVFFLFFSFNVIEEARGFLRAYAFSNSYPLHNH